MDKPSINDIAQGISHILKEDRAYSGAIGYPKDEIDVKGDGSLWAQANYEVAYNWTHSPGDRMTPAVTDFDVTEVRVVDATFYDNNGGEVEVGPDQANQVLVDYFWSHNLGEDEQLAELIDERSSEGEGRWFS